ncbi:hypothetical protein KUCAC02_001738 [Chaenocephalus aceratus]|uniref:Uncharacterized protein n=1 Tax=Chaenocephalus aceratus TaxID=36190 RepID=A0ACB9XTM0_CHAAC|nr:hypothetical protein KUCAC02_001738 [Chaenocephalus aceratus]
MSSLQFNSLLLDISNQLTEKQLEDLKFLCGDMLGKRELEKISSGVRLFQVLTERMKLGADNTDCLSRFLTQIQRQDLAEKLESFESQADLSDVLPDKEERDKLGIATEVIVENLGKNWRKMGRRPGPDGGEDRLRLQEASHRSGGNDQGAAEGVEEESGGPGPDPGADPGPESLHAEPHRGPGGGQPALLLRIHTTV